MYVYVCVYLYTVPPYGLYSKFINIIVWDNDCVADQKSPVFAKIEPAEFGCRGYCRIAAPS